MWLPTESEHHINYLELLAAFFALQCFYSSRTGKHVTTMIDNTSAVSQINNMGTCHSEECNSLVVQIWEFCISHNIPWLTAARIPGSSNVIADGEYRHLHSQDTCTEWMLNPELLTGAFKTLNFQPEIDLFASRLNKQLPGFCSFTPDPEASFINAFTISFQETLLFSSFQLHFTGATENQSGSDNLCGSGSQLANPSMVPSADISPHPSSSQASGVPDGAARQKTRSTG